MVYGRKGRTFDWITFSIFISLVIVGWLMVYASTSEQAIDLLSERAFPAAFAMQGIWVMVALIAFLVAYLVDSKFWVTFAYPVFGFTLILLILVLIFGARIKGATAWFQIAGFSLQPSEFAKIGTALAISSYLSHYKTDLNNIKYQATAVGIIVLPVLLILLQPDAGSALVFISLFILLFREGMPAGIYVVGLLALLLFITSLLFTFEEVVFGILLLSLGVMINSLNKISRKWVLNTGLLISGIIIWYLGAFLPGIWIFSGALILSLFYHWKERNAQLVAGIIPAILLCVAFSFSSQYIFNNVLKPHQQDRINVWLQPEKCDPRGSLYNVLQSKVAIGSGGLQGKGYLEGTMTKLNYVPEQSTDFIFSTIGEEQGFIGALGIIGLFLALMLRIILIGERTSTRMYRHFAYAVAGFFFIHTFVNIGMTMGLVPIMGIPLPLISKGGSSLLAFSIMLGILLRMDRTGR